MSETITDVIAARTSRAEPMGSMVAGSVMGHVLVLGALLFLASMKPAVKPEPEVMMISLNTGSPGPRTGGMTDVGGREVKEIAKPDPARLPEPTPAAPPKMSLPIEKPRPTKPQARQETKKPVEDKPEPKPSGGPELTKGTTQVDTGARGTGFGISSSGGTGQPQVSLDVSNFCCNEYLQTMVQLIKQNWQQNQGARGSTVMKFTIQRNGRIDDIEVEKPSSFRVLDLASQRALSNTVLPPLPEQFTNPTLTVHIRFDY